MAPDKALHPQQPPSRPRLFRTSIRELLLFTALVAVGFASLRYANAIIWTIYSWFALFSLMFLAVVALADRGARQGGGYLRGRLRDSRSVCH
ncbi:MAG: hypothetical protein MPJ50_19040 [Pirellulales bacterium]|nr:hypothetical protein [Pirellulales bacterium]